MKRLTDKDMEILIERFKLFESELNQPRAPHLETERIKEYIRTGNYEAILSHRFMNIDESFAARQGPNGDRLMEYLAVDMVCTSANMAYAAGMPVGTADAIADTFFHLMAADPSLEMVLTVFKIAPYYFARRIHQMNADNSYLLERIKSYVAKNIFQKITLGDIAAELNLSPSYVSRFFSKKTGMTLHDYIQQAKIESSCNMLIYSDQPIAIIAQYYGFQTQSNYGKIFKKWMGVTPSTYKNQHTDSNFLSK